MDTADPRKTNAMGRGRIRADHHPVPLLVTVAIDRS